MKIKSIKEIVYYTVVIGISILTLFFFVGCVWIGNEAKSLCQNAKWQYGTSVCVDALLAQLDDKDQGFRVRNHAIWALGQIGDRKALTVLQKYYTGNIPDREPLDEMISQYELKKAIALVNGGPNITAWLWRGEIK